MSLIKKQLTELPFQLVYEDGVDAVDQRKAFAKYSSFALPQALAYVGNWSLVRTDGKLDLKATIKQGIKACDLGSEWASGLIFYLITSPRGLIIPTGLKATSSQMLPYSALVPLIMAAFKKYKNIPYNDWTNINHVVDPDLYASMTTATPHFTSEELLELRVLGSTVKTGDKAGTVKNPMTCTSLVKTGVDEFDQLPRLTKIMLTQCWLAHPAFRHEYMVLDPSDWDNIPKSLIDIEVLNKPSTKMPWDD